MNIRAGHPAANRPDRWRRRARVAAWFLLGSLAAQTIAMFVSVLYPFTLLAESNHTGSVRVLDISLLSGIAYVDFVSWPLSANGAPDHGWQFGAARRPVGKPVNWAGRFGLTWPDYFRLRASAASSRSNVFVALPLWCLMLPTTIVAVLLMRAGRRRSPPGCCPACRYDLTANTSGICPECGSPIEPTQTAALRES